MSFDIRKRPYCPFCNANPSNTSILFEYTNKNSEQNKKIFTISIYCGICKRILRLTKDFKNDSTITKIKECNPKL